MRHTKLKLEKPNLISITNEWNAINVSPLQRNYFAANAIISKRFNHFQRKIVFSNELIASIIILHEYWNNFEWNTFILIDHDSFAWCFLWNKSLVGGTADLASKARLRREKSLGQTTFLDELVAFIFFTDLYIMTLHYSGVGLCWFRQRLCLSFAHCQISLDGVSSNWIVSIFVCEIAVTVSWVSQT